MHTVPSLLHIGCTRILDNVILEQRIRYAAERDDFHTYFEFATVRDIQRILRGQTPREDVHESRRDTVIDLLCAQQRSPHTLWTLLLIQAFEDDLIARRRALSETEDVALDNLVLGTFIEALDAIPHLVEAEDLRRWVLHASRRALVRVAKQHRGSAAPPLTEPPLSALLGASVPANTSSTEVA